MKIQINYLEIPKCNYLYVSGCNFLGYEKKLSKEEKKLIGAKLIWKRKKENENKKTADQFAIQFADWAIDYSFNQCFSRDLKELLEEFKKEKTK